MIRTQPFQSKTVFEWVADLVNMWCTLIVISRRPTLCVRIYKYFEQAFVHIDFEYTHRPEHNIAVWWNDDDDNSNDQNSAFLEQNGIWMSCWFS